MTCDITPWPVSWHSPVRRRVWRIDSLIMYPASGDAELRFIESTETVNLMKGAQRMTEGACEPQRGTRSARLQAAGSWTAVEEADYPEATTSWGKRVRVPHTGSFYLLTSPTRGARA